MKTQAMKFVRGVFLLALASVLFGAGARGQTAGGSSSEKEGAASKQESAGARVDTRPFETIYLKNVTQTTDANEIVTAVRNMVDPSVRIYLVPNQNAMVIRGTPDQIAMARKVISDLDRPKSTYRLTYTITEIDGGKRVGSQRFAMIATEGQRTVMKQGSRVPIATGSYKAGGTSDTQTQFTYLDIGMNFDATLDETANGAKLRTKVEQLSIAEEHSGVGPQDPIVRQAEMEGMTYLTLGKPQVLGSLDIPGSTRHLDVEVVMELVR
jgi:type II secretory pathway component GspD/PulD (secretin)